MSAVEQARRKFGERSLEGAVTIFDREGRILANWMAWRSPFDCPGVWASPRRIYAPDLAVAGRWQFRGLFVPIAHSQVRHLSGGELRYDQDISPEKGEQRFKFAPFYTSITASVTNHISKRQQYSMFFIFLRGEYRKHHLSNFMHLFDIFKVGILLGWDLCFCFHISSKIYGSRIVTLVSVIEEGEDSVVGWVSLEFPTREADFR